eukprot:Pgem_evm1s15258
MNQPEEFENAIFDRLSLIQEVVLCRLETVLAPDELELQVELLELLQVTVMLNHFKEKHHHNKESIGENPLFLDTILIALNMS